MPFCSKCGWNITLDSRFCNQCGEQVVEGGPIVDVSAATSPAPSRARSSAPFVLTVAVLICGFCYFMFSALKSSDDLDHPERLISQAQASPTSVASNVSAAVNSVDIHPSIHYVDGVLEIQNNSGYDWGNVEMKLNPGGLFANDYKLRKSAIPSGTKISIYPTDFVKDDGTRFNIYNTKPMQFQISCDTPQGKHTGFWIGDFKE